MNIIDIVYMVLGDAAPRLETFVRIFNNVLRSVTWSLFDLKASNLDRWPILNVIFHVMVSIYRLVQI